LEYHSISKGGILNGITCLSSQQLNKLLSNIRKARDRLATSLCNQGPPRDSEPLHSLLSNMKRYGQRRDVVENNLELHPVNGQPALAVLAVYPLRHILYTHNLPLPSILNHWASFHVLIMRTPLEQQHFILQTTLWNNVQRLHYIDSVLITKP
jgi:hypothetical protein